MLRSFSLKARSSRSVVQGTGVGLGDSLGEERSERWVQRWLHFHHPHAVGDEIAVIIKAYLK